MIKTALTPVDVCEVFDECVKIVVESGYFANEQKTRKKGKSVEILPGPKQLEMARWLTDHIIAVWRG